MLLPNVPQVGCSQIRLVQAVGGQVTLKHLMQPEVQQWVLPSQGCLLGASGHKAVSGGLVAGARARLGSWQQHTQEPVFILLQVWGAWSPRVCKKHLPSECSAYRIWLGLLFC